MMVRSTDTGAAPASSGTPVPASSSLSSVFVEDDDITMCDVFDRLTLCTRAAASSPCRPSAAERGGIDTSWSPRRRRGVGHGRAPTLPALMTTGPADAPGGPSTPERGVECKTSSLPRRQRGVGRGRAATLPAWMTVGAAAASGGLQQLASGNGDPATRREPTPRSSTLTEELGELDAGRELESKRRVKAESGREGGLATASSAAAASKKRLPRAESRCEDSSLAASSSAAMVDSKLYVSQEEGPSAAGRVRPPQETSGTVGGERGPLPRSKRQREEETDTARRNSPSSVQCISSKEHVESLARMLNAAEDGGVESARSDPPSKKYRKAEPSTPPSHVSARGSFRITHHRVLPGEGPSFAIGKAPAPSAAGSRRGGSKTGHRLHPSEALATPERRGSRFSAASTKSSISRIVYGRKQRALPPPRPSPFSAAAKESEKLNSSSLLVVIDGSNAAFAYREGDGRWFAEGPLLAIKYFEERGIKCVAFIPCQRVQGVTAQDEAYEAFQEARASGAISLVPANGNDDLYFLKHAIDRKAFVVTNDQFRDHAANEETLAALGLTKAELKNYLLSYHVSYTFARDEFVPDPEAPLMKELTRKESEKRRERQKYEEQDKEDADAQGDDTPKAPLLLLNAHPDSSATAAVDLIP